MTVVRKITFFGTETFAACDGRCDKAWGTNMRPIRPDAPPRAEINDVSKWWLKDDAMGEAPANPGTTEGDEGKPTHPPTEGEKFSRWCVRECERNVIADYEDRTEANALTWLARRIVLLRGKS